MKQTTIKQSAKQTKYIFVTGGVVSGLGKGITAAHRIFFMMRGFFSADFATTKKDARI